MKLCDLGVASSVNSTLEPFLMSAGHSLVIRIWAWFAPRKDLASLSAYTAEYASLLVDASLSNSPLRETIFRPSEVFVVVFRPKKYKLGHNSPADESSLNRAFSGIS